MVEEDIPISRFILDILNSNEVYQSLDKFRKSLGLFFFDSCYVATISNILHCISLAIESKINSSTETREWDIKKIKHHNREKNSGKQILKCLISDESIKKKSSKIINKIIDFHEVAKQFQVRIILKNLDNSIKQYEIVGCPITIYILEADSNYLILNPAYQKFNWIINDFDRGTYMHCTSLMIKLREYINKGKTKCNHKDNCKSPAIYVCRKFDFLCKLHCGTSLICPICNDIEDMHIAYQKTYSNNPVEEIKEHIPKCDRCRIYNQSASILCKYCAKAIAIYYNIEDSNEQEILNRYNP